MNRTMLYKAKREYREDFIEGYLCKTGAGWYIYCPDGCIEEVNPDTFCQYIELNDKNGKKIFESDIVKVDDKHIGYVYYDRISAGFVIKYPWGIYRGAFDNNPERLEVIGNKYVNPKLLKKEYK